MKGELYTQKWANNMSEMSPPKMIKHNAKRSYTKISFEPDLSRFPDIQKSKESILSLMALIYRRSLDVAACLPKSVSVLFNEQRVPVANFADYVRLFSRPEKMADGEEGEAKDLVYSRLGKSYEVAVGLSSTGSFENMSFVNNVWTSRGGSHVSAVTSQVVDAIEKALQKKGVSKLPSSNTIRNKLMVFVNALIENPSFEGQTKDSLVTKSQPLDRSNTLPTELLNKIVRRTGIVEQLLADLQAVENNKLVSSVANKGKSRKIALEVPKLEDALLAGTDRALDCTLILTEGDSAKALAVAGLEVVGRETFGVFPLKGASPFFLSFFSPRIITSS